MKNIVTEITFAKRKQNHKKSTDTEIKVTNF